MMMMSYEHIEIKCVGSAKEYVVMGTELFIVVDVLPAALLAYQVSMVSAANQLRYPNSYI